MELQKSINENKQLDIFIRTAYPDIFKVYKHIDLYQILLRAIEDLNMKCTKTIKVNLNEIEKISEKLMKVFSNSSYEKGLKAEEIVASFLQQKFTGYSIADTRHVRNSGDFILKKDEFKILIEVKHYSKNVPSKMINKFISDMDNANITNGIFISINRMVSTYKKIQHVKQENKNIIVVSTDNLENVQYAILLLEEVHRIKQKPPKQIKSNEILIKSLDEHVCSLIKSTMKKSLNTTPIILAIKNIQNVIDTLNSVMNTLNSCCQKKDTSDDGCSD